MTSPDAMPAADGSQDLGEQALRGLATILRLREDFLVNLIADKDDWSFVVKAHAFVESVICSLLSQHLRKPALEEVLAEKIEMSARIDMSKALGITTSEDRKAIRALGTLRNRLVHNAKETNFTFEDYFASNSKLRSNFLEVFGHGLPETLGIPPSSRDVFVARHPKFAVLQTVIRVALYVLKEMQKVQTEMALEGLRQAGDDVDGEAMLDGE